VSDKIFDLTFGDELPILEVQLLNPDGSVHDLTGSTAWQLRVKVGTTLVTRDMFIQGDPTLGILRYQWQAADDAALPRGSHRMRYRVSRGTLTQTFPARTTEADCLLVSDDLEG
jgi:hypothetical protein